MKTNATRRTVLSGLSTAALTACTPSWPWREEAERPAEGGVGGTGIVGILTARSREVGTLVALNGIKLEAEDEVQVDDAFGATTLESLVPGQALSVEAAGDAPGRLAARSIRVTHPVIGPLETVLGNGRLRISGLEIEIEPGAILAAQSGAAFDPTPGQRIAVSGLWRGDRVVASRLDLLDPTPSLVAVAGEIKPAAVAGRVRIGSLPLDLPAGTASPATGGYATVVGRLTEAGLRATSVDEGRFRGTAGPLRRLSVEGYLEPTAAAPGYAVSGLGHSFDREARLARLAATRTLFVGPYDGAFRVRLGLPLPDDVAARGRQLAAIEDGFDPPGALSTRF